nr:retrovirus-related Pol polyprotein from transposon TNT 1-94 [Tanacetum cinerariifolium]
GLEVGLIRRIQGIGYGVLELLGVGTTLDIFQNIISQYFQYDVLVITGYDVFSLFPLWSLVSAGTDTPYLPLWIRRTAHFGNNQFAPILGYMDLVQGNIMINRVYYVKGLNHNLFSVGQFCDADLEVAFWKSTFFVRDLHGNDLLTGNRRSDLYTNSLQETTSSTLIFFMAKASPTQAWLWHRRLSHLNFDYINLLSNKDIVIGLPKLKYVSDQLCSSYEVSKAKKKFIQDKGCSKFKRTGKFVSYGLMWSYASKDETPKVLKDFLKMIQRNLQAQVITVRTDRGKEFLNKTLHAYFKEEGIERQTSTPRTPEQNGISKDETVKEKWDPCILVGYSTQSKGYCVYNKRTRLIVESIHIKFDEIKEMSEMSVANNTSGLVLQRQKAPDYDNSGPGPNYKMFLL